jgi:hypothetical protein
MVDIEKLDVQYLTDTAGRKVSVVIPLERFEEMLEDIDDLAAIAERREEPTVNHADVLQELKKDGLL